MTSPHGGSRQGAGRPKGSNKYKEPTVPIRVPLTKINQIKHLLENAADFKIPLFVSKVRAGFPSPADDYIETHLDLNTHLISHPAATFFVKAAGDSMVDAGIYEDDLLVVDRSIEPVHGKIVIAALNGELTVKRLSIVKGVIHLVPENKKYKPILITETLEFVIWGVVIHTIRSRF